MAAAALGLGQANRAPAPAASAPVIPNGQTRLFNVELSDMFVRPSSVSVPHGTTVVLHVVNYGAMSHDLQLEGGATGTGMLAPGQAGTVSDGVFGRTGQAWCTEDKQMQVAPGVTQDVWTFGRQVPGPVLRGHVGDEFIVTLINRTDMTHSLDFHAASQPMLDHHLDHAAAGAAGYIDASVRGRGCSLAHIRRRFLDVYTAILIKTITIEDSRLPPGSQRKETKA